MEDKVNTSKNVSDESLLDIIMHSTNDAIVFIDCDGYITKMSNAYARFLNIDIKDAIGKHITEVIENTRMHLVLKTGIAEVAQLQRIRNQTMIATRIPLKKDGKIIGVFGRVIFKSFEELNTFNRNMEKYKSEGQIYKNKFRSIASARYTVEDIIGSSLPTAALKDTIDKVARTNSNVLVLGESGTGKELVAHAIHSASNRSDMPLICVNCASFPSELMESELFGYEEGSFTGAKKGGKIGLFEVADNGTLFLDEIGDISMPMQAKLLRALQEKEIRPVGSSETKKVNVRIIAATSKNLDEMVREGKFREDLFYRLNVVAINVPPLRKRIEDIPELTNHIINKISEKNDVIIEGITINAMNMLMKYSWPGNVRELENVLERAANFMTIDRTIHRNQIEFNATCDRLPVQNCTSLKESLYACERHIIYNALHKAAGSKTQAAKDLKISRTTLYEKLDKFDLL